MLYQQDFDIETTGHGHVQNLTHLMADLVRNSGIHRGLFNVFILGSTAAFGTIEFEPGLEKDLAQLLDRLVPPGQDYGHPENAHAHLQASLLGPSLTVPIRDGALCLGPYQQIVLVECDDKPHDRKIMVTIQGE